MSYRVLWWLAAVAPLACGRAAESQQPLGQCGQGTGANAAAGGGAGVAVGGSAAEQSGAGGTGGATPNVNGDAGEAGSAGSEGGAGTQALPLEHASCQQLVLSCGSAQTSCCEATELPGGAFARYGGGQASVSDFRLDKYEVTVGRFRAFVEHYASAQPTAQAGKNPHDAQDHGWDPSWNEQLLASAPELSDALYCSLRLATWGEQPADDENRPINCLTWYEAQAFCIWDGGRLPSDLEWEYAAQGGSEGRPFPWGNAGEPIPHAFANCRNGCNASPQSPECKGLAQIWRVGSAPGGNGRWGQSDLAGNLWEYTLDYFGPALACADCARHIPQPPGTGERATHVSRGGSYNMDLGDGLVNRDFYYPSGPRAPNLGFRCAYDAKPK